MLYNGELNRKIILTPPIKQPIEQGLTNFGSYKIDIPPLPPIVYKFANNTGSTATAIIGDPSTMIRRNIAQYIYPRRVNNRTEFVTPSRNLFANGKVLFHQLTINNIPGTPDTPQEAARLITQYTTNHAGVLRRREFNIKEQIRNNQTNNKLITLNRKFEISLFKAITFPVYNLETVYCTLQPLAYLE